MAEATNTGGCGPTVRSKQVGEDAPVGTDWSYIVGDLLENAAAQARAHLESQDDPGDGAVEVRVRMTAFLRYSHEGTKLMDEGLARCVCTNDGEVCVCYGQCDFDACCDSAPPPGVMGKTTS